MRDRDVDTEDMQLKRVLQQLGHKTSDIDRYVYLVGLLDHNETLFYRTLMSDPARFLPSDNSTHGFDNIAGALTMSPALMEAYLSAAGKISRLASKSQR